MSDPHRIDGIDQTAGTRAGAAPSDAREARELRTVVSLLRSLPDPDPPEQLAERAIRRVRALEARPRVIRVAFERLSQPAAAAALAAGLGCLVLIGVLRGGALSGYEIAVEAGGAVLTVSGPVADDLASRSRRPSMAHPSSATVAGPVPLFSGPLAALGGGLTTWRTSQVDRGLDRQLNLMLLDPNAFFRRLDRMTERDRFLARLAERAAQRGDSAHVALQLRASRHPMADPVVDRLLNASLAEYLAR